MCHEERAIELSGRFVPCVRRNIPVNDCARSDPGPSTYLDPRKNRHIDPGLRAVSKDGSELLPPAVYPGTPELLLDLSFVKSQIGGYGACSEGASLAEDTVSNIGEVRDFCVPHYYAVLYLASRANLYIISDR